MDQQLAAQMLAAPPFVPQQKLTEQLVSQLDRQDSSCVSDDQRSSASSSDEFGSEGEVERRGHRSGSVVSDASEEGGPDSGCEADKETEMVIPDQDLMDRIVTQVEIYFSDANVAKDKFLLKHIRRNKEGFVSLKLVSSFKKIKQLTKDWRVVSYAITHSSSEIILNDLRTKIRRTTPLPDIDDTPVTCTVLALNLPLEKPTIDTVSQLFGQCGDIALIRVLRSGAPLSDQIKPYASKYQALNNTNCAWIEFESPEAAKEACKTSSDEGMKVVPVIKETQKKSDKQVQQKSQPNSRKNSAAGQHPPKHGNFRKNSFKKNHHHHHQHFYHDTENRPHQRRKAISLPHDKRPNLRDLNVIAEEGRNRRPKSKSCVEFTGGPMVPYPAQYVQRHLFAAAIQSAASTAAPGVPSKRPSRISLGSLTVPDGVKRFPKGPDGSRGFGDRRGAEVAI